jgi:hypothetical protein
MSYIRIANKADGVNRLYLEKLGLSTKRDNENTIGQFGSGSKFAPIAALRNGWEWINVGEDDLGPYKMEYVIKEESGINCIYYLYDDEVLKPSSFVAEAGLLSWDSEFQIFREAFSNALDEFTEFGNDYSIDIVDEVKYEPGVFAVYLTADPDLLDILRDFDKYFVIKRNSLATCGYDKIYASFDNEANFYYKGVLVFNDDSKLPMFNYEFSNITLNEERRIRNTYELGSKVTKMFYYLENGQPGHIDIAETLIHCANKDRWEWSLPIHNVETWFNADSHHPNNAFKTAWANIHGDSVAVSPELMRFKAQFALRDVKTVEIKSPYLYAILTRSGVPCADSVLGDEVNYEFMTVTGEKRNTLDRALSMVKSYLPRFDHVVSDMKVFIPQGDQDRILGVANMTKGAMYLSINAFESLQTLVGTIVHEYDHLDSQIGDEDNSFRGLADNHIGNLLIKLNELGG